MSTVVCVVWRAYPYRWRSRGQARCVTSPAAALTLLLPSHLAEPSVDRGSTGEFCCPAPRWLGRIRWEERRRAGEVPGVTGWAGKLETPGCTKAGERQEPRWLPAGSSCWPARPGDAAPGTCRTSPCLNGVCTWIFQDNKHLFLSAF